MIFSLITPGLVHAQSQSTSELYSSLNDNKEVVEAKVSKQLASVFEDNNKVSFIIKFKEKADAQKVAKEAKESAKKASLSAFKQEYAQRSAVISELKATAQKSQQNVNEYLEQEVEKGNAEDIQSFHIVNGIAVLATKEVAEKVASFEEVEAILPNERIQLNSVDKVESVASIANSDGVEQNVSHVGAPDVWNMGIDGSGVVVAVLDSGVDWNHPALKGKYRGYNPETGDVDHRYSWYDATAGRSVPYDDNQHGTHVTGTILGSEPDGSNKIGVAPGAQWIGVKMLNVNGSGSSTEALRAAEWVLAPGGDVSKAPDIVNNSWSGSAGFNEWYREAVIAWRAAGIFPEFSAGNEGPGTIAVPANYPESFATGAVDYNNNLASFSSTGPAPYDEIKPDISAPGVNIRSSVPGGRYESGWNGTSMAGPAVSGVVALILSADNRLSVDEIEQAIKDTATPLTNAVYPNSPNNGFGYGLINAFEAVSKVAVNYSKIEGKVTKEGNNAQPLSATINVVETGSSVNTNPADGTYSLPHKPGKYTVMAEAYGYQSKAQSVTIEKNQTVKANFALAENPKGTVSGKVTNQRTDEAIEGATLLLVEDANVEPIQTDANGKYSLTGYDGTYTLKVMAPGFHDQEIKVSIKGNRELNVELEPVYTVPGGEIGYDDGTIEDARAFYDAGNGWAVKMSLAPGKDSAIITEGVFQFYDSYWPYPGGTAFAVEVWDATGPNGFPGKKLAGPINATAKRSSAEWTVVDLRDQNIKVDGDFYMVYVQTSPFENAPGLAIDDNGYNWGRTYDYLGGDFVSTPIEEGNAMIRVRIDYESEAPSVITSPADGLLTNKADITVKGKTSAGATVQLMNNGVKAETAMADGNGNFSIPTKLKEGQNEIKAVSNKINSAPVNITLDTHAPVLTIDNPQDGFETNKETVTIGGIVSDDHLDSVKVNGQAATVSNGHYSKSITLKNGKNEITVTATDKAGNVSQAAKVVVADKTVPKAPVVDVVTDQSTVLTGKAESGSTVIAKVSGKEIGTATAKADGTFEIKIAKQTAGMEIVVTATDKAGNVSQVTKVVVQAQLDRISGYSRYDTAIEISERGWTSANTVIVTRGDNFADALAGVPLAHKLEAPILMTPGNKLWDNTLTEIKRLGAKNIVILGGEVAVSKNVSNALEKSGLNVRRISGHSRFDTAALIAAEVAPKGTSKVVVANGMDFPDALSVASHAAKNGLPILLTQSNKLPDATKAKIKQLGAKETIVVGGEVAVSKNVEKQLPKTTRLSGHSRYDTNIAISEYFGVASKHLYVATGKNYADALTGAVLAAKDDSTILLVHNQVPATLSNYIKKQKADSLSIFGGEVAVNKDVENALRKLLPW
ncbi:S8 family serine peptidase [Oceanobacillus arenosus]